MTEAALAPPLGAATIVGRTRRALGRLYRTIRPYRPIGPDVQLNVYNFQTMLAQPPSAFEVIRFDPNNDCNINCVYCHNPRNKDLIADDAFLRFVETRVTRVNLFQFGCVMEPTLDARLADLMEAVSRSPARPRRQMMLQSNGLLLNRHDAAKMAASGLTDLSVSVDSADPGIQKSLRGGMKLDRVLRNVDAFRRDAPGVRVTFIATVTAENAGRIGDIVQLGLERGVRDFVLREMFYLPDNAIVDHERMPALLLGEGRFDAMASDLRQRFGRKARFLFAPRDRLLDIASETREASRLT